MKHIKRKYLLRVANSAMGMLEAAGQVTKADYDNPSADLQSFITDGREKIAILATDKNELVIGFVHSIGKNLFAIPEPDPVLVYFNNAQRTLKLIDKFREDLFSQLEPFGNSGVFAGDVGNKLYDFMFASTSCTIFLFTAIEAMMNKMIPTEYIYEKTLESGRTKLYDFESIQRRLDFKTKLHILTLITRKSFNEMNPDQYQQILNLKALRDSIIHTKRKSRDKLNTFSHIFKDSLSFDYYKSIYAVRDLINFYQPFWIEECTCGQDF